MPPITRRQAATAPIHLPPAPPPRSHRSRLPRGRNPRRPAITNAISKRWPEGRPDKQPRGIGNSGNSCYMNSALQNLVHLPKFCSWIKQHNDAALGADWACRANDPNRHLPVNQTEDQVLLKMGESIKQCVACLVKAFVLDYWSNARENGNNPSMNFPHTRPSVKALNAMARRWSTEPPSSSGLTKAQGEPENAFINRKLNNESASDRNGRRRNAAGQQDSDEFLMRLLNACKDSIDPGNHQRLDEFNYLFTLTRHEEMRCTHGSCTHLHSIDDYDITKDLGFSNVMIAKNGHNHPDLQTALAGSTWLDIEDMPVTCGACNHTGDVKKFKTIEAAPEYLRINLELNSFDKDGEQVFDKDDQSLPIKNTHPIIIPNELDLTAHVSPPSSQLRYKFISKIIHSGNLTQAGHYTACVTTCPRKGRQKKDSPPPIKHYFINDDHHLFPFPGTDIHPLTHNPETQGGTDFEASTLIYERLPNRPGPVAELYEPPERIGVVGVVWRKGKKEGNQGEKRKSDEIEDEKVEEKNTKETDESKGKKEASDEQSQEQKPKKRSKTSESTDQSSWDTLRQAYKMTKIPGPLDQRTWTAYSQLDGLSKTHC